VVNENDTVTTEEIRFGDNDTLAALVTNLVEADLLILLTDQAGLFEGDPRDNPDAQLIQDAEAEDPVLESMASAKGGGYGLGGMLSKVRAAKRAARSGASTIIASGRESRILERIVDNERLGTHLYPAREPLLARKQWLAGHLQVRGRLTLDAGAVRVLRESGGSLLSVGVTEIKGHFARGEVVACYGPQGEEVARGLVNYNAGDSRKIMGQPTRKIESLLGYIDEPELIHRDNLVLL
jgi:glutamate 5-kinase